MTKVTVEYARTVRLKQYESLRIGTAIEEIPGGDEISYYQDMAKNLTEMAIRRALEELKR